MRCNQNLGYSSAPIDFTKASDVQYFPLGTVMYGSPGDPSATANVPNAGGKFIYAKSAAAAVIGAPLQLDKDYGLAALPNTGNTGAPLVIAASEFSTTNTFGWVCESGQVPVKVSAAAAAGAALFISGAGTLSSTIAAGKQILGISSLIGSTGAFTKAAVTTNGSPTVKVSDIAGLYVGLTPSGTGIAASTITAIDAGRREITLSANATASGSITATFTHTGYVIANIASPHVQGQIT